RLEDERRPGELDFDFTTILADNRVARRLLEAGLASLPCYLPVAELLTLTLSCSEPLWRNGHSTTFETSTARPHELGEIAELLDRTRSGLQLAPTWSRSELESPARSRGLIAERFIWAGKGEHRLGCAAVWDQSEFKQVVVRGYSRGLERWRGLLNALAPWTGSPKLPPAGSPLRLGYLSHVAVPAGDAEMLCALIAAARRRARRLGLDLLALGLDSRRPELAAVRRQFRCRETRSVVYLVSRRGMVVPEEAFDRDRFVHPEIALL
ncbi:MAG: hypothetical protein K8H90_00750, partial [Thermoanaerobaculia bacterium]|nr:hypothetical protein [Thermoanaerobaculia bacterium]